MSHVSVVIPAHNAERTVRAAIDSVLGQTYADLEVLVVDDGSTDTTAAIVEEYGPPVSCLRTTNRGVSHARNLGLARAAGELVALIDADDLWQPTKLERQLEMLAFRPDAYVSTTASLRVTNDLRVLEELPARDYSNACAALLLYSQVLGNCSSVLMRREILDEIGGFDTRFSQCADVDLFLRLSRRTRFAVVDEPLVLYRMTGRNMSADISLLERDAFAVLDRFFSEETDPQYTRLRQRAYSNHWMVLSGSYLHAGQLSDSVRCLVQGLRLHPRNVRLPLGLPARSLGRLRACMRPSGAES